MTPIAKNNTASRVEALLQQYNTENENGCIMVCVTRQRTCERLIVCGAELAQQAHLPLCVVNITPNGQTVLGSSAEGEALDYLFRICSAHGADMTMLRSGNVARTLVSHARKVNARTLVMGETPGKAGRGFAQEIQAMLPDVKIVTR